MTGPHESMDMVMTLDSLWNEQALYQAIKMLMLSLSVAHSVEIWQLQLA